MQFLKKFFKSKSNPEKEIVESKRVSNKKAFANENELLLALSMVGVLSEFQIQTNFQLDIRDKLIDDQFIMRGMLEKKEDSIFYYTLTSKGKSHSKKKLLRNNKIYIRDLSDDGVLHDIKLADIYLGRSPLEKRSWITKNKVRVELNNDGFYNFPENDGAYVRDDGTRVGVEVKGKFKNHATPKELKKTLDTYEDSVITASFSFDYYLKLSSN